MAVPTPGPPVRHLRGIALVTGGALCLVPDATLIRLVDAGDLVIVFWRSLCIAVALAVVTVVRHGSRAHAAARGIGAPGLLVGALWAGTLVGFVYSINHTAVANTLVVVATAPLFAGVFSRILLGERTPRRTWLATAAALAGVAVAVSASFGAGAAGLDGDLAALGVAVSLGGNLTIIRRSRAVDMLPALGLAGVLAALVVLPAARPVGVTAGDAALIAAMGLVLVPAAFSLITLGTRDLTSPEVSLLMLLETVLAPLLAWPVLGERPPERAVVGGAIVVATLVVHSVVALAEERRLAAAPAAGPPRPDPEGGARRIGGAGRDRTEPGR